MQATRGSTMTTFLCLILLMFQFIGVHGFGISRVRKTAEPMVELPSNFSGVQILSLHNALTSMFNMQEMPTCQQLAAKNIVHSCAIWEKNSDDSRSTREVLETYQTLYAIRSTACVLEDALQAMPAACTPLLQPGLRNFPQHQIKSCLDAIYQETNAWTTFLTWQTNGAVMCQTIRSALDRDDNVRLHQELIKVAMSLNQSLVMNEETITGIYNQMKVLKNNAREFHREMLADNEKIRADLKESWSDVSDKIAAVGNDMNGLLENVQQASNGVAIYSGQMDKAFKQFTTFAGQMDSRVAAQLEKIWETIADAGSANQFALQQAFDKFSQQLGPVKDNVELVEKKVANFMISVGLLDMSLSAPLQKVDNLNTKIDLALHLQRNLHDRFGDMDAQANATYEKLAAATEEAGKILSLVGSVTSFLQGFLHSLERIIGASWATCLALLVSFVLAAALAYKTLSPLLGRGIGLLMAVGTALVITPIIVFVCDPVGAIREACNDRSNILGRAVIVITVFLFGCAANEFRHRVLRSEKKDALYDPAHTFYPSHDDDLDLKTEQAQAYY